MTNDALKHLVQVRGRFHRSVQLIQDWRDQRGLAEYLLTPTAREIALQILAGAGTLEGPRAWSITGPYGTGKSAFALFLSDLLANETPKHAGCQAVLDEVSFITRPFVPVLVAGQRASLTPPLLRALGQGLDGVDNDLCRYAIHAARSGELSDREIVALFERAAHAVKTRGYQGLLVIVDEFGKFLEHAAQHPDSEDLFVLQELAEAAARSEAPIILLTILHSAFAEYLTSLDETRREEWQKVQGRFADIAFLEPPEQFIRLIGAALEWTGPNSIKISFLAAVEEMVDSPAFEEARLRLPLHGLLPACSPLHPIVALLLWPLFRSKLAQNERTLFAFLVDRGPFGFQEFLSLATANQDQPDFYQVDHLYDYVTTTLGPAVYLSSRSRRWAEIGYAVDRISADAPSLARGVVKAVGLLALYGAPVGLRASKGVLKQSLGDSDAAAEAIDYLERASIIVYRRYEDAYALWEGSDVDLEACYEEALKHMGHGKLASRLKRVVSLRPLVARAHYIKTGTLRFFGVEVVDGTESTIQEVLEKESQPADGGLSYVLVLDQHRRDEVIEHATELTSKVDPKYGLRLLSFPKPMVGLEEALQEVEAWSWVSQNVQALQGDPVGRQEAKARSAFAQKRLRDIAGRVLGLRGYPFAPAASDWVQGGGLHRPGSAVQFQRWLSALFDNVYDEAPILHNELINRENLSSAAAAARRTLIEAMIENGDKKNLGIMGTPAEFSMYRGLLEGGGFHRQQDSGWQFDEPSEEWQPVWQAMKNFLRTTEPGRLPILDLVSILKMPPFGLREGPIPVLLCALLLVHRQSVALYEDGMFVPELRIEVLERMMRAPGLFEIQQYRLSATAQNAFAAVNNVLGRLGLSENPSTEPDLLEVIRPLILFAARLPDYSKRTKRVEPTQAAAIRDALLSAQDPINLIFKELPDAVGITIEDTDSISEFANSLKACLDGLWRAYPQLLDEIESQLRQVFGLHGTSLEARQQLKSRARPLDGYAADRTLSLFVLEAGRLDDRDWREVLARVVNKGMPPTHWHDADVVTFQMRLRGVASDFVRLEELVTERHRTGVSKILRIGVLDGRFEEARAVVAVSPEHASAIEALADRLSGILEGHIDGSADSQRIRIAALARVAERCLRRGEQVGDE